MHLLARVACRRHLGRATEGRRATDTTDNQTQQVRAAVVPTSFPTSASPHDIHLLTFGQTSNHAPHLHPSPDLDLNPHHTPPCMRHLRYAAARPSFSPWHCLVATRLFTPPFPVRFFASRRTCVCRPLLLLPEMCCLLLLLACGWLCENRTIPAV